MKQHTISIVALSMLVATHANAGAYMFPELGMMSNSTAGAGAQAIAEGAETAFANPAAMSEFDTPVMAFNIQGMVSSIDYTDNGSTGVFAGGDDQTAAGTSMPVGSFYYIQPINEQWTAGVALASSGGSLIDYGPDYAGALLLQDAQLLTVQLNPSVSYKVNEQLSFGVGLVSELGVLEQNFAGSTDGIIPKIEVTGDSLDFGYTLSSFYKIDANNQIGFTYRSEIDHELDGEVTALGASNDSSINVVMPAMALLSGHHQLTADTAMMWSLGWTDFSKIAETPVTLTNASGGIARDWKDTVSASVGVHYQLNSKWRLESGVYYETSPQDDPTYQYPDVPTGEIWKLGMGASYELNSQWRLQMYYEYLYAGQSSIEYTLLEGSPLESTLQGDYDIDLHFFGLLMNYRF
ncbi:OmpP1/FadL family transporter [Shewanella sp. WPAGA9]|uniref:OmpP1/FadL family transporter n=1 Tax=Shewanella sp. ENK2 TaxID=2775245 RepID=UPI00177F8672|nr:outer membrane protein transport protein [Shewanella sp. WPAGA9]